MPSPRLGRITIPNGKSRNNLNTGASLLACSTKGDGSLDTVIMATSGGTGGDAITIALVAGAPAGVTISRVGTAFTIHYRSGVSTVADVEAAIAALSPSAGFGEPALIAVDVPGTGATVLTSPGASFAASHLAGGAAGAFTIPLAGNRLLYYLANAASLRTAYGPSNATTSLLTASSTDFPLTNAVAFWETLPSWPMAPGAYPTANGAAANITPQAVVAIYNGSGGSATVDIYGGAP